MPNLQYWLVPFLLFINLNSAGAADKSDNVIDWLQRMVNAVHSLNYEGTFVFLRDKQLETMQLVHTVEESGEKERLFSLNGVPREVFRDNASVTCISPDMKSVSIGNRMTGLGFRAVYSMDVSQLSTLYSFHILGKQRVADRHTVVIAIIPRDHYRYGYRIYLDSDTAFPLKSDMMDINGEAISQIMFTHLEISPSTNAMQEISVVGKENYAWTQQKKQHASLKGSADANWRFDDMPTGFKISFHSIGKADLSKKDADGVEHFVISDGLASLSVYIEKGGSPSLVGASNMGAVNAFGRVYQGFQITAVGEVPAQTVQHVATVFRNTQLEISQND